MVAERRLNLTRMLSPGHAAVCAAFLAHHHHNRSSWISLSLRSSNSSCSRFSSISSSGACVREYRGYSLHMPWVATPLRPPPPTLARPPAPGSEEARAAARLPSRSLRGGWLTAELATFPLHAPHRRGYTPPGGPGPVRTLPEALGFIVLEYITPGENKGRSTSRNWLCHGPALPCGCARRSMMLLNRFGCAPAGAGGKTA